MSQDYHFQIVVGYDGKYPLDEYGHFLDPHNMRPVEGRINQWHPKTIKGQKMLVFRKSRPTWDSPRKVALANVCHKKVLGNKRKFFWAKELTNPYGALEYAIGDGDDFWCFDYAILEDGRVVLDATINSETGSFIMGGGHKVVPIAEAAQEALSFIDNACEWCGNNDVTHSKRGWNQDPYYFYRSVFYRCDPNPNKPDFSYRELRHGGKRINKYCGITK